MKDQLPADHHGDLDFKALVETLQLLEGEEVVLWLSAGKQARVQVKGVLRFYDYGGGWGKGFAVSPAGRVLLVEDDFRSADLWTFEGNEYFSVSIRSGDAAFALGSPGHLETDEFDLAP
jgi:hypothetical protein